MTDATHAEAGNRLEHFPVPFFAVVMGLSGLTLALHAAETVTGLHLGASTVVFWVTVAAAVAIAGLYALKALRYPQAVAHEWHHPVRMAFFPAISISMLLLATASYSLSPAVAHGLWLLGMALQGVLTIAVVSGWISARAFQTGHLTPAWFIPAVGNVLVPIVGVPLGYVEISWYFMAVGLLF